MRFIDVENRTVLCAHLKKLKINNWALNSLVQLRMLTSNGIVKEKFGVLDTNEVLRNPRPVFTNWSTKFKWNY